MMKRTVLAILVVTVVFGTIGCGSDKKASEEKAPSGIAAQEDIERPDTTVAQEITEQPGASATQGFDDKTDTAAKESVQVLTPEQARDAIKNYCYSNNPDLKSLEESGEYPIYWGVVSSEEDEIVILYRSYTGSFTRYYINPSTGDTFSMDYVPGITDTEIPTDEFFNVKDYID